MDAQGGDISVGEAKQRLLEWSELADEAMHQEIHEVIATAKQGAMKAIPWAAGAALVMGLFAARSKRGGERSGGGGGGGGQGILGKGIGILRMGIKVATIALPLVRPFFAARRDEE